MKMWITCISLLIFLVVPAGADFDGSENCTWEEIQRTGEVGVEYYDAPYFFDWYDNDLELFHDEDHDIFLDLSMGLEDEAVSDELFDIMEHRGFSYSEGIYYNEDGFYYEDSFEWVSWEQAEKEAEEAGVSTCSECGNLIVDSYDDHADGCSNDQRTLDGEEAEDLAREDRNEALEFISVCIVLVCLYAIFGGRRKK